MQQAIVGQASPSGWVSSLYLVGAWALPWWLGRLYLRTKGDVYSFAIVLAGTMLLLLPNAIFEGASEMRVHALLYGEHPFAADGMQRYLGFRPQGLFEHGNQYGLWCATATVAALWLARCKRGSYSVAGCLAAMTIASQSVGAILLLIMGGIALYRSYLLLLFYRYWPYLLLSSAAIMGLLVTGALPLRQIIEQSATGQALLDAIRATGRGSFAWRISQDLKVAPLLQMHLLIGHGQANWFLPISTRPWGFPLLVIGQFGLIGAALLILPFFRAFSTALWQAASGDESARFASVIIIISGLDAAQNSFLFWPFIPLASCFATKRSDWGIHRSAHGSQSVE
jgi:hypothetical protein